MKCNLIDNKVVKNRLTRIKGTVSRFTKKIKNDFIVKNESKRIQGSTTISTTLFSHIFDFSFSIHKMKQYVCRNLCENFTQIGQKMKKL